MHGALDQLSADPRDALVEATAEVVRRVHDAGFAWRGMDARHLYPEEQAGGSYRIWLIDCEGVHTAWTAAAKARDVQRLLSSVRKAAGELAFADALEERLAQHRA